MAKKNKKIDKETRKLIEAVSDMCKRNDDGSIKIKGKKKEVKKIRQCCPHWIIRKGKEYSTVTENPERNGELKCRICGTTFPMKPLDDNEYDQICKDFLQIVNQAFFYSVKMGGDSSDTKVFETCKRMIPRFNKIVKNEMKTLRKREIYENRKNNETGYGSQFGLRINL